MSLNPELDAAKAKQARDAIELCGKNRGTHDYIPIEWVTDAENAAKRVTRLLCRTCFSNVAMETIIKNYPDVSI